VAVYDIKFTDEGLADAKSLQKAVRNTLKKELTGKVAVDPRGCSEPLTGSLDGWFSFHYLEYRVVYKVYDDLLAIAVAGIGKHDKDAERDIYRKLEALAQTGKLAESVLASFRGFSGVVPPGTS
jgi:mRNA-degrading endonuclease RelE of RelBE toxin-antitoxin system